MSWPQDINSWERLIKSWERDIMSYDIITTLMLKELHIFFL